MAVPDPKILTDIITKVGTWIVIALLGYAIATTQDRYTASTAKDDREAMMQRILEIETRALERLQTHIGGGPHDRVDQRLTAVETTLTVRLDSIVDEVRLLRQEWREFTQQQNGK